MNILCLLLVLSGVDCQCMNLLSPKEKCRERDGEVLYDMSLRRCLSTCLNKKECLMLQWKSSKWKCYIFSQHSTVSTQSGHCLTLDKVECQPFDHTCMEKSPHQVHTKSVSVNYVDELDCRFLCVLWSNCSAYTHIGEDRKCHLQEGLTASAGFKSNTQSKGKHGRKNKSCKTGERDVTFRYGANSDDAKQMDVSGNFTRCLNLLLGISLYSMGVWNIQNKECWLHKKTSHAIGVFRNDFELINIVNASPSRHSTQKACVKTEKGSSYETANGVFVAVSSLSECLHICLSTVNCHSVSWGDAMLCYLHQIPGKFAERNMRWSLHTVEPCTTDKPIRRSRVPKKSWSWCWRRVSTDVSDTQGLIVVSEISSLLQCCVACTGVDHCTGVTWLAQKGAQNRCFTKTVKDRSPMWRVSLC